MDDIKYAIKTLSEMADDFLLGIIAIKRNDMTNNSLPFMHAHALELSAKAACYHLGIDVKKNGHDIMSIYKLLNEHIPVLSSLVPTVKEFEEYRKTWLIGNSTQPDLYIDDPMNLYRLELAYYIDNVMNLKYGLTKDNIRVSLFEISYKELNSHFLRLFNSCRKTYLTDELNDRYKKKVFSAVGQSKEIEEECEKMLNFM